MPSIDQHQSALRKAEQAGDTESAKIIERRITLMQSKAASSQRRADTEKAEELKSEYDFYTKKAPGQTGTALDPFVKGATLSFSDELAAGLLAGTRSILPQALGGYHPDLSFGDAYKLQRDLFRNQQKDFAERNPATSLALELSGGLAAGGAGGAAVLPTVTKQAARVLPQRIAPTAATTTVGAIEGAIEGAGAAEENVGDQALIGAGIGGFLGGAVGETLGYFARKSDTKDAISRLIETNPRHAETAGYLIDTDQPSAIRNYVERLGTGDGASAAGTAAKDKLARDTLDQGFDPGVIAPVQNASKTDAKKLLKMTEMMERGIKDKAYQVANRPADVAGNSLSDRVSYVMSVNRQAAQQLDGVANSLKGQAVDVSDSVGNFKSKLEDSGINLEVSPSGRIEPNFMGSDIEGLDGAEKIIRNIVNRMSNTQTPDAYDVHRLKRFIDENVTYGKRTEGLSGRMENILKSLRRDLDGKLDDKFPEYNRVNTTYSDTRGALDQLQNAVGNKLDMTGGSADKALGQEMRKLMSNYRSRTSLLEAIPALEEMAGKYGKTFDDDLILQSLFVDELNSQFGTVARTSLAGETEKAVGKGIDMATGGKMNAVTELARAAARKVKGVNDEKAFESMKALLKRQSQ